MEKLAKITVPELKEWVTALAKSDALYDSDWTSCWSSSEAIARYITDNNVPPVDDTKSFSIETFVELPDGMYHVEIYFSKQVHCFIMCKDKHAVTIVNTLGGDDHLYKTTWPAAMVKALFKTGTESAYHQLFYGYKRDVEFEFGLIKDILVRVL